ncbi:hypothetical protein LDG_5284 [Legionella drancourtii LLAP12]|uniref:Uncharacterized protein n=1 Tax=Legionella drancourtii LLAP12 TaxID=658187 RepID=G9EJC5_9GAMM|nr:hypothetical protein LDG_5284 [Legionella drancourtii LLAP12]
MSSLGFSKNSKSLLIGGIMQLIGADKTTEHLFLPTRNTIEIGGF